MKIENEVAGGDARRPLATGNLLPASIVIAALIFSSAWVYAYDVGSAEKTSSPTEQSSAWSALEEQVLPSDGVVLPVRWGSIGLELTRRGVVDARTFVALYEKRGGFSEEYRQLLFGDSATAQIKITRENAGYLLNLFWALGLANKNPILESGEMTDLKYGGAGNFASTGGWSAAKGDPMDHYSAHRFVELTPEQQSTLERVASGIYRPCCGNSTHFPDCNHGMAMLGLLELMAAQGASEEEMWKAALVVNSYWFPDSYLTIASYMKQKGVAWESVSPREILGANYSSASGYASIAARVSSPGRTHGGSGCDLGGSAARKPQGGCGL